MNRKHNAWVAAGGREGAKGRAHKEVRKQTERVWYE